MPNCKKCGKSHYNFNPCPEPQPPILMAGTNPWGTGFSNTPVAFVGAHGRVLRQVPEGPVYQHPMRVRTGSLTTPPEWDDPPQAA